jgi:predicted esterase YcpF (UPF0227 family)
MVDSRDRLIRLETEVEHLTVALKDVQDKVHAMHDLLMQAKGMRWIIIGMASMAGFFASFLGKLFPFLAK